MLKFLKRRRNKVYDDGFKDGMVTLLHMVFCEDKELAHEIVDSVSSDTFYTSPNHRNGFNLFEFLVDELDKFIIKEAMEESNK